MENTIWTFKIEFKEEMTMRDRQKLLIAQKQYMKTTDEMQVAFDTFVILCSKIDGVEKTDQEKMDFIQWLSDMDVFVKIQTTMTDIANKMETGLEKKKKMPNINSKNEIEQEKST